MMCAGANISANARVPERRYMKTIHTKRKIQVLGIAGSLRKGSYNRALLQAARELAPESMQIHIFDNTTLENIPAYNDDIRQKGEPETVEILKKEILFADALLFAIPEYNASMSGVLKNAIDWASRPHDKSPLEGKPVAMMGASTGRGGTKEAQMEFRQVCTSTKMLALDKPQVLITHADEKFDSRGHLIDEDSRRLIAKLTEALLEWTGKVQSSRLSIDNEETAITRL
jgi:chromate reductase